MTTDETATGPARHGESNPPQQAFVRCQCGKERPVRPSGFMTLPEMERFAAMCACKACEMDVRIAMDSCPESVAIPGGSSACRLTWHHDGRCEPYDLAAEMGDSGRTDVTDAGGTT